MPRNTMSRSRSTSGTGARRGRPRAGSKAAEKRSPASRATAARGRKRTAMTNEHKAALAAGRAEGRAVRAYLEALERHRPRRGRRRTPDTISRRLNWIDNQLSSADPLNRLHLLKEKGDLEAELERSRSGDNLASLEKGFVKVAKSYGERKGITYSVWRAAGVPPSVLQSAGVIRGGGHSPR
jgi:hypothetical protein